MLLGIIMTIVAIAIEGFFFIIFDEIRKRNEKNIKLLINFRHSFKILTLIILVALLLFVLHLIFIKVLSNTVFYVILCMSPIGLLFYRALAPIYSEKIIVKLDSFGLYLRAFKDDEKKYSLLSLNDKNASNERGITNVFNRIFPVFAVGQPLELLAPLGAKRIYIEENNWREQIAILSQKTKFILLKISDTENFLWECKYCVENVELDKLIFFWIDDIKSNITFKKFTDFFKTQFAIEIPDYELSKRKNFFIYFKDNQPYRIDYVNKEKYIENIACLFLDTHPKLNEENEFYIKNENKTIRNLLSFRKNKDLPKTCNKWNWGAFIFSPIYGFLNRFSYLCCFLIVFIDLVLFSILTVTLSEHRFGDFTLYLLLFLFIHFFWGKNGNKTSWILKRWAGKEIFKEAQQIWNIAGIITIITLIFFIII